MPLPKKKSQKNKDYLSKIYLWYGMPKVGKTTTGAGFGDDDKNKILFFPTEPGHKFQEIYKYQYLDKKTNDLKDPSNWSHWLECCRELAKDSEGFRCIAVDTLDNLWKWCTISVLNDLGIKHESELGFGKGYHAIRDEFFKPLNYLAQNNFGLIFMSHEATTERKHGPRSINYTDTTLPGTCRKLVHGICDYIFYFGADHEGKRYILTKATENYNAGDRSGILPKYIRMDASELKNALQEKASIGGSTVDKTEKPETKTMNTNKEE